MFYLHFILEHWGLLGFIALSERKSKKLNYTHNISGKKVMKYHTVFWNLLLHEALPLVKLLFVNFLNDVISFPQVFILKSLK